MKFNSFLIAYILVCIAAIVVDTAPPNECPQMCTFHLAPVCGRDEKVNEERVFSNECVLEATNCLEKKSFVKVRSGLC